MSDKIRTMDKTISNMIGQLMCRATSMRRATEARRIDELKMLLQDSDYKAIKYAKGWLTGDEYAFTKAQRQEWRDEINRLEGNSDE